LDFALEKKLLTLWNSTTGLLSSYVRPIKFRHQAISQIACPLIAIGGGLKGIFGGGKKKEEQPAN
jgi:hypothetical protein